MSTALVFTGTTEPNQTVLSVSPVAGTVGSLFAVAGPVQPVFAVAVPAGPPASPALDPYLVYLGRLTGESRRAMAGCLDRLARLAVQAATGPDGPAGADGPHGPDGANRPQPPLPAVTGLGFPWADLRYAHTARIFALIGEQGWSPAYANKHLSALRQVLKEAWRLGLLSAEDLARASDLPAVAGSRLAAGRMLTPGETAAILDACTAGGTVKGLRDAAVLAVAYSSGCRRAELIALTCDSWTAADRSLTVLGKGNKQRRVYLAPWAATYLQNWLRARGRKPSGPLFVKLYRSGRITDHALSGQSIADILDARSTQAGTPSASPHDLRRTFISTLLADPHTDLVTVQTLAGHASPTTTARYDHRPETTRRDAVSRLPNPHKARV